MVSSIKENQEKYLWIENGQKGSIIFRIMRMLNSKMWKCNLIQINSQHYPFVVHISNLVVQWGLGKHYHLCFDPKLGIGKCAILRTPCACVACTSMMDKAWISGLHTYWQHHWVQYGKTLMVVLNNTDVPLHCTWCQWCHNVNPS